jgi:hypothetical protein
MSLRPLRIMVAGWRPVAPVANDPLAILTRAWGGIVGARVAEHSQPLELSGDALVIATHSSAWSQQLQFLGPQILERIGELGSLPPVARIRFRTGPLRTTRAAPQAPGPAARSAAARQLAPPPGPALDERDAFERLRGRIGGVARAAAGRCSGCGAPTEDAGPCAPCRGAAERERRLELDRLLFNLPWLDLRGVRGLMPQIEPAEFEAARRDLLQRWWTALERARRTGKPLSRRERQLASSYVLLHSGLDPERITPAVVRNLLGDELEAQLYRTQERPARS